MLDPAAMRRAVERIADQRIREAMEAGKFDRLPGEGEPIPHLDDPVDDLWWVRQWLARERLTVEDVRSKLRQIMRMRRSG